MVGKNQIQIGSTQFTAGLCTSDYITDGGIGTSSTSLSLLAVPGTVRATAVSSMSGSVPASTTIIASCEDPDITSSNYSKVVICDDGSHATIGNTTFNTFSRSASTGFVAGVTDAVSYMGAVYVTRQTTISKATTPSSFSFDSTWWTGTLGKNSLTGNARHPLLVFEGNMFIGNGNLLAKFDGTLGYDAVVTFNTNERITAFGIDPNTGLMMIAVRTVYDTNDQLPGDNFVYLYDGISSKARRKIKVDGAIWAFESVGGQVFVGMNNVIGVWNGAGVTFLRRLTNTSSASTAIPTKARMTHFQNTLLVVDNNNTVLAYGDVANGKRVWTPLYYTTAGAKDIALITFIGNDTTTSYAESPFILATGGTQVAKVIRPMDLTTVGSGVFYTNSIVFGRPVFIRRMRVLTTGITSSNGGSTGIGGVAMIDETGAVTSPTVGTFKVASGTQYMFDFDFSGKKCQLYQAKVTLDTQAFGIYGIIIYYDVAE